MDDIKRLKPKRLSQDSKASRQPARPPVFAGDQAISAKRRPTHTGTKVHNLVAHSRRVTIRLRLNWPTWLRSFYRTQVLTEARKLKSRFNKQPLILRIGWGSLAVLMIYATLFQTWEARNSVVGYQLSDQAQALLVEPNARLASYLKFDSKKGIYNYNQGYSPSQNVAGETGQPKFTGSFSKSVSDGATVTDPVSQTSVTFTPQFSVAEPKKDQNRLIYPLKTGDGARVYTFASIGVKEDILLNSYQGDQLEYKYKLGLSDGTEARIEKDGSLGIYGVSQALLGNVSASTAKDQALLQKARQNGKKTDLLYTFPAPFVAETDKKVSHAKASFRLDGNTLTVKASNLKQAHYPLSIDPSVYIDSAARLMRGNNDTNIDFDVDNQLIQKSQTTGARIDAWTSTNNLTSAVWGQGTAVAGGYIYTVGGGGGNSTITSTYYSAGSSTYLVPTGVTSITVKAWGAGAGGGTGSGSSGAGGDGGGGGYAKAVLTVTPAESLTVRVGTGGAAGSGTSNAGNGGGYSALLRSATFLVQAGGGGGGGGGRSTGGGGDGGAGGGANGVAGTSGTGGGGARGTTTTGGAGGTAGTGGAAGAAGIANAGGNAAGSGASCATAGSGTGGAGGTGGGGSGGTVGSCEGGGGGGGGRFGGGGGGSASASGTRTGGGGGGGSDLVSGASTVETAGSGATPGNDTDTQRSGSGSGGAGITGTGTATAGSDGGIVISYTSTGSTAVSTVSWSQFNTSTNAIQSPNPGDGTCTGWCTNSAYDLPAALKDLSLVAYNGFLYAIGGATGAGTPQTTVYIAKLGANGEPQLWHPTDTVKSRWSYWYSDTALSAARSKFSAVAYNNRIYILGGLTTSSTLLSSNTVQYASITPTGVLTSWSTTGMQALSASRYGLSAQVYNDTLYVLGGDATFTGSPITTVQYSKLNSDGTMNSWTTTSSLITSGRLTMGGNFATIWAGYVYVAGGCTAVNASGYCTTIASDVQLASINADGSLAPFNTILGLTNSRIGHTLIAWQGGLYRLGGCRTQNTTTGTCDDTVFDVDYGVINQSGEASTVANSVASGVAPCSGGSPSGCELPGPGTTTPVVGDVLTGSAIINGYLYIWGGCSSTAANCSTVSRGAVYTSVGSDGSLTKPASCGTWTALDSYCYNTTSLPGSVGAPGTAVYNGYIYSVGGFTAAGSTNSIYYAQPSTTDGTIASWSTVTLSGGGSVGAEDVSYPYVFARANPSAAASTPGNLYILGGCGSPAGIGCGTTSYTDGVYKCTLSTAGVPAACSQNPGGTNQQLQIGTVTGATGAGLGAMAGTVYANYIYLMGGLAQGATDLKTTRYAKIDNNNNIVAVSGGAWVESANQTFFGRRRGAGFGYNGFLYVVGGYDGSGGGGGVLADIEFAKINVSDGSIGTWSVSSVNINQRWGLTVTVSNSYAYVIGGCISGTAPNCDAQNVGAGQGPTNSIQTFQVYNNDSGAVSAYTAGNTLGVDRTGGSSTIMNGYIYYTGGCTNIGCSAWSKTTYYAAIDAYGTVGTWATVVGADLPTATAWGKLVNAGGTLYYVGGQTGNANTTAVSTVFYTTSINGSGVPTWGTATKAITNTAGTAQTRTQFGATVWNNRIYVAGGYSSAGTAQSTVLVSPQLNSGGNITTNWSSGSTSFNVARVGVTAVSYANNLYILGGNNGTNYLSDVQFSQIDTSTGDVGSWTYSTNMPNAVSDADGFAANGYIYVVGGRSASATCRPVTLFAPISANTTIATGNNPTGVGAWSETNQKYTGNRFGAAVSYNQGRVYLIGGGCSAMVSSGDRMYYSTLKSQPQVAKYSRMIDTDGNVFPTKWLMNGLDNSIGSHWQTSYQSAFDSYNVSLYNSFDTGTLGNNLSGSPSPFNSCAASGSATNQFSNTQYVTPGQSMRVNVPSGSGTGICDHTLSSLNTTYYARFYMYMSAYPNATTSIWNAQNTGNSQTVGSFRVTTTGQLQLRDLNTADYTSSASALPLNVWNRIEVAIVGNQMYLRAYFGNTNNQNGNVADLAPSPITLNNATSESFDDINFGLIQSQTTPYTVYFDDYSASLVNWAGSAFPQWGQTTNFGDVTLGTANTFSPKDSSGANTSYARWYYFSVVIDGSRTFGYPEDVTRGPTIADLSLFFTADPGKRLRHGKTFTGGELQPDDTPF